MHLQIADVKYGNELGAWKPHGACFDNSSAGEPLELGFGGRDYQKKCYERFHKKRRTLLIAPTGSGKSPMQVACAAREILECDYKQKQVFVVPQLDIGNGFSCNAELTIDGKTYPFEVTEDCCKDDGLEGPVERIKKFLISKKSHRGYKQKGILGGCTAVVSYVSLLEAFKRMTHEQRLYVIQTTSFRLDEVHHISGVGDDVETANRLGVFTKFILDHDGSLHLTTATFFRGDRQPIIDVKYLSQFEIFTVPFLEHWEVLGLRELHQIYRCYKKSTDLLNQIVESIAAEPDQPTLVIVPQNGVKFFKQTDKWKWVKKLVCKLEEIYGYGKVLDLVSPDRQEKDKKRLIAKIQDFSAVVTCGIGREGTNWPACSRIHNTILDANVLQPIQKLGRALRQYKGKVDVKMFNYIEHFNSWDSRSPEKREKIRQLLSDRHNAVIVASMLDDMFCTIPIIMPTLPKQGNKPIQQERLTLDDVYGGSRNELIGRLVQRVLLLPSEFCDGDGVLEVIDEIIEEFKGNMLRDVPVELLRERLKKEIVRRLNPESPNLRLDGVLVNFIRENGWDKVVREHIKDHSPYIGAAKTEDLKKLKEFLDQYNWDDLMEALTEIKVVGVNTVRNEMKDTDLYFKDKQIRRILRQRGTAA